MGGEQSKIAQLHKPPTVVMMVGLQGAGKTTTTGKLANLLRKKYNRKPLLLQQIFIVLQRSINYKH